MRSAYFTGEREVQVEETPTPQPRVGEALIEVRAAGICGSDLHRYRGLDPWGGAWRPWRGGHEVAGVVVEAAPGAGIRAGQRVAVEPMQLAGCGTCAECLRGEWNICQNRGASPLRRTTTGFAEFDIAAASHLHEIPGHLPFHVAALTDVYACAVHALHRIPVAAGDTVLIIGCGPVGLALGQAARLAGATTIIAGKRDSALAAAVALGAANRVINISHPAALDGIQPDVRTVFEAAGGSSPETIQLALRVVSPGGTIGILGAFTGEVAVPYREANRKEITLRWCNGYGSWRGQREFLTALDWLAQGQVNGAGMVTHCFPLHEISRAFQTADEKARSGAIKVMIVPGAGS